uniref:Uncharacterized protein n=1 Tax=Megaselia scalaris TaxID=36166 RepID=T1GD59_MEGSC
MHEYTWSYVKAAGGKFEKFHTLECVASVFQNIEKEDKERGNNNNIAVDIKRRYSLILLNIAYKILASIVCEWLKPHVIRIIGPYQCDIW